MLRHSPLTAPLVCAVTLATSSSLASGVKETDPSCSMATAILAGSRDGDHDRYWRAIALAVRDQTKFRIVDSPERNVAEQVAFRQFEPVHEKEGAPTAFYAAVCGHGGTCNEVAKAVFAEYPEMTPPVVHCGDVGNMLTNPKPITLP